MLLQSFFLSSWSSMSYKNTLSHLSQHRGSKYVGTTGLPLTHLQESAYFWSPTNELRPGHPVVPSGRTVVHITSCLGARWYISLTTLSRRRRSKPLAVDHNWPFLSCVCAEDGSTRTTGRVLRRWLMRRRKYKCKYKYTNLPYLYLYMQTMQTTQNTKKC